jgi:hypothetical protein
MKKLTTIILTCSILGFAVRQAGAAAQLSLSDGTTTITIVDEGAGDAAVGIPGQVEYVGPVGANWYLDVTVGSAYPGVGSPAAPAMDIGSANNSLGAGNLTIDFTQDGFTSGGVADMQIGGNTVGLVTYQVWVDAANAPFAKTTLIGTVGPIIPGIGGTFSGQTNGIVPPANPYSITMETAIQHLVGGHTGFDASLTVTPPQCNCTVSFNSPATTNICQGEGIPNVVASQTCAGVLSSVPVTVTGTVTNGVCPQMIITRTNIAVSGCNVTNTFVQTIMLNCTPDCTLALSTAKALVGSNYTASVADAGPGATYSWSIDNGTILPGPNTTSITWKAGTDTSNPVTIFVTVTTGAGCTTVCNQGVPFAPPPPSNLGRGDTATIGFWHNKNGQALILNAPNSPALGNWLGTNFSCLFGSLKGKANSVVAAAFLTDFGVTGQKTYAQILGGAFAIYFTSSNLAGNGAAKYGFNVSPGGTGAKAYNVGSLGTAIGLQNNQSYTILQLLKQANSDCPLTAAQFNAFNTIFSDINQRGDIN